MQAGAAKKQAAEQYKNETEAHYRQRAWDMEDRDEFRQYSRQVLSHLVEDAEAAGFNPLTVLRAGGGASYNAGAAMAPLSRPAPVKQAPLGAGAYMGQAVSQFGRDFMANFDPFQDDKRELESQLVAAQIANLNASTARLQSQSFNVPVRTAGATEQTGPNLTRGWDDPTAMKPLMDMNGVPINIGPGSAAEDWEQEYGEVAGELEGLPRYLRDRVWPALKNTPAQLTDWLSQPMVIPQLVPRRPPGRSGGW